MINAKRIMALFLSATMFVSIIGGSALAAPETSNPGVGGEGYVALQQFIQPTSDPNIFKVSMTIQAPADPKPADVMIVLDASGSMIAGMGGSGDPSRWAGAITGANAAINIFTDPAKNPAADKTRVGVSIYNDVSDDIVTLTSSKADIMRGMGTLDGFYSMQGSTTGKPTSGRPNLKTTAGDATDLYLGVNNAYNQFDGGAPDKAAGMDNAWLPTPKKSEVGTRKYVIFLSDGINTVDPSGPALANPTVALDLASYMKTEQDVNFMTIGLNVAPVNYDKGLAASSFTKAWNQNYPNWNKKATVDYKKMINPLISTATNVYSNPNVATWPGSTWAVLGWAPGAGSPFADAGQAEDGFIGLPARVPEALNRDIGAPTGGTSDPAWAKYHPNALIGLSAMHTEFLLGVDHSTQWLSDPKNNLWDGTQGYIDIPGDQYWSPDITTTTETISDGPQALIYMAQLLDKSKVAQRGIALTNSAAQPPTGPMAPAPSAIWTWQSSSPLLWGYEASTVSKAVSQSNLNTGAFYWNNWINKNSLDYGLVVSPGMRGIAATDMLYQAFPTEANSQYPGGATDWLTYPGFVIEEGPVSNSIGDVYNADTVLRNSSGEMIEPNFRPVSTLQQVVDAFEEFANKIIRFGENVKVDANINNNWEIVDRYGDMTDWYAFVGGFEGQTVTRSGNNISWDPIAIPMIGQSTLTYYVRFTGNQTDKNMYYPIFDSCQISFMDNYNMQNIVNRVKNFPTIFANPSTNEVKESNVVKPNSVDNGGSPSTIGTTGNVINDISSSATLNTNSTTSYQGAGGGIAFLGTGPQAYTASVANTAAAKKNKKTAVDTSNDPETLSDSEYKAVQGKSLKAKSGKVAIYSEPKKNANVALYINKGKTFKIAGATDKYYMVQYKKKDGKVQKGYILKTDVSVVNK